MDNVQMRWVRDVELRPPSGGACIGMPTEWWFPKKAESSIERQQRLTAKKTCMDCPVRQECLDYAIEAEETYGIWGGMSWNEREQEIAARRKAGTLKIRGRVLKAI
jgi:WhiB family redox-sensing transcriptional regulator